MLASMTNKRKVRTRGHKGSRGTREEASSMERLNTRRLDLQVDGRDGEDGRCILIIYDEIKKYRPSTLKLENTTDQNKSRQHCCTPLNTKTVSTQETQTHSDLFSTVSCRHIQIMI